MTTRDLTDLTGSALAATSGDNTHFQYDKTAYQKNNGDADPQALTVVGALGVKVFRERLSPSVAAQTQALDALTGMKVWGHPGDINSDETTIRAAIHAYAISARAGRIAAITGVNEPNNRTAGSGPVWGGVGTWQAQVVAQQYWIKDQVEIERAAGNFAAGQPKIIGAALKHEHVPYDADIAALAAATYVTAGVTYHMADLCDAGDFHFYQGWNGPGFRMNGKDDNGSIPPGVSLSSTDSRVSQEKFELQRARQAYDSMLTGGTGALSSGHWKYTGGSVTTGHGATFPMCHSEGGTPIDAESGHTAEQWQAKAAVYVPEMLVRDYSMGCLWSIPYQVLTDPKTDGLRLGQYNLAQYPTGALPPYTEMKSLLAYNGGQTFVGVGAFKDTPGALPDCTGYALSVGSGEWWLYILREADTTAYLQLSASYVVENVTLASDGTYHLALSDSLTKFHVLPNGTGGAPVWTTSIVAPHTVGAAYNFDIAATGTPTYALAPTSGPLPPGLALSGAGHLSGTPTTAGSYPVVWRATNGSGHTDSPDITITISVTAAFTADSPPLTGTVGVAYGSGGNGYKYTASGFPAPTFAKSGTMVPGMALAVDGTLDGTPTTAGSYTHNATASNVVGVGAGGSVSGANHTIVIGSGGGGGTLPVWLDFTLPTGTVGAKYGPDKDGDGIGDGVDLSAFVQSGSEACTYAVGSGVLPLGMVLTAGGKLRNSPNAAGDYTFTVNATDSAGTTPSPSLTIKVVDNGNHGSGQSFTRLLRGPNSAFSDDVWFKATTMDPNGDKKGQSARFIQIKDVNGLPIFVIRVKASGKLEIDDGAGNKIGKGDPFLAKFSTAPDARWRLGCVVGWDGTTARLIATAYANPDSTRVADQISVSAAATDAPFQVEYGNKSGEIYATFDTHRESADPSEIPPENPVLDGGAFPLFTLAGPGPNPASSIRVHAIFDTGSAGTSVSLAYDTSAAMDSLTTVGTQTVDTDLIARWTVTGLPQDTDHYFSVVDPNTGELVGKVRKGRTMPDGSAPWELKWANLSCMSNPSQGSTPQIAWQDVVDWNADVMGHSGDWGYWGQNIDKNDPPSKDLDKYVKSTTILNSMRAALENSLLVAGISDHELHVNGDLWDHTNVQDPTGAFNCPHTVRQIIAFMSLMPIDPTMYGDTRTPKRGRYYSFDIGTQVRVIVPDFRTPDRSNADDADSAAKTMYGAEQYAWIKSRLDSTRVNIIAHETSNWDAGTSLRATDKPAAYHTNQVDFNNYINAAGPYAGGTHYRIAWFGGDRHRTSYLSSADNTFGGFPQFIGSGMFKNALALQDGELVTWSTWVPNNTVDKFNIATWQQLTLSWDGTKFRISVNGRWATTITQVTDGTTTSGSRTVTCGSAPFVASHVGQLIAGDGIVNVNASGKESPTTITAVTSDGTGATLSQAAKATRAGNAAWVIQNHVSTWEMTDYPGGSPSVEEWTFGGTGGGPMAPEWIEG